MALDDIRIVLVEPAHPGNIGAAARAMKTMGLGRLVLVRPKVFPSQEADRRAVHSVDILERAEVVDELAEAIGDCRLVIGGSARPRSFPHPELDARQCATRLIEETATGEPAALVFGTERTGLENRDLDRCTHQVLIPTSGVRSSLNLAAAVQILCYEVFLASRRPGDSLSTRPEGRPSHHRAMEALYADLENTLDSQGYFEGTLASEPRQVALIRLRRLFGRARPNPAELKLIHSLLRMIDSGGD